MKHTVSLGILLFALWLLLSNHFNPLMISFGVVSVFLTLWVAKRLDVIDEESHPIHLTTRLFKYWFILAWKILQANLDVALRILGFKPVSPQLIRIPFNQADDLSKVIYANSITLTPGSASIHIENGDLIVHTISEEGARELFDGELARIVPQVEETQQ